LASRTRNHTKDGKIALGRAAELKKKIEALSNISTFVQAVMVFPLASVKDDSSARCNLHVQPLITLKDYLERPSRFPNPYPSAGRHHYP